MGLEYIANIPCKVREQFSNDDIVERIKARNIIEIIKEKAGDDFNEEMKITWQKNVLDGENQNTRVSIKELSDMYKELEPLSIHCESCTANRMSKEFGCVGFLGYPVSKHFEKALMDTLPDNLETTAGKLLKRAINELGYTGKIPAEMRKMNMFESPKPLKRKWGGFFSKFVVDSNMVFEMIFTLGDLNPEHCSLLCLFFGILPYDIPKEDYLNKDKVKDILLNVDYSKFDASLRHLFNALASAAIHNVRLLISY